MELKASTSEALDRWLGPGTWYKNHPIDIRRLYDFVDQYQKDHGYVIDESALREEIERRVSMRDGVSENLRNIIRARISLAYHILHFLERTGR
jgi:hypothetical protein